MIPPWYSGWKHGRIRSSGAPRGMMLIGISSHRHGAGTVNSVDSVWACTFL